MTNDTRTSDEIERDIADERAQMSNSINDLQKKFSVEAIVGDVGEMLRTQGGDLGRAVSQTVGRNPAAVALVGVGLAWLFLGQDRNRSAAATSDPWGDEADRSRSRGSYDAWDRQGLASGRRDDRGTAERDPYWYGNDQMARVRKARGGDLAGRGQSGPGRGQWAGDEPQSGMVGAIKGAAETVGDAMSGAASGVSQAASDLTERLSHGLEDFSEEARTRVLAARRAAHDARMASGAAMKKGARAATNFFEDQPLVVGALAVALGAAMGGVLPHTKIEDDTLGASRDDLFARAQTLFREEREKATATVRMAASDVKEELKGVGSDLVELLPEGKNVGEVIVDRAAEVASRVYGHASGDVEHDGAQKSQS